MTILLADFPSGQAGRYGNSNALMHTVLPGAGGMALDPHPGADGQGYVWGLGNGANFYMDLALPYLHHRFVFSMRIFMSQLPPELGLATIFRLWEDQDQSGQDIQIYPDGSLGNTDPCFVTGAWQLLEVMWGAGDDFQGLIVRVDGEVIIDDATGGAVHEPEPPNPPVYFWRIVNSGAPSWLAIKDFVMQYDEDAEFIGPANVRMLLPSADVTTGWTLVGGASEFATLDNSPPNVGQYISAPDPAVGVPSVTTLTGLHANTKAIAGLIPTLYASSADGGTLQAGLVESATLRTGATFNPGGADFHDDVMPVDPSTGDPWVVATVAALNLSINRTA